MPVYVRKEGKKGLNIQYISFLSLAILLLGIFAVIYDKKFMSIIIAFQLIIISAIINFLSFSLFLYTLSSWDKVFIFFGVMTIYMLTFIIVIYNYSKQTNIYEIDVLGDVRLFVFSKSDWWGEDKD